MSNSSQLKLETMPTMDSQGNIYVLSVFNDAVYKFTSDGILVMSFGRGASDLDDVDNADAFAVDRMGNVYISDSDQIHFFRPDGRFVRRFDAASLSDEATDTADTWCPPAPPVDLWATSPLVA